MSIFIPQFEYQLRRVTALGRAQRVDIPFSRVAVRGGNKRRLPAHGQTHIAFRQFNIDRNAQRQHGFPLAFGVGAGHTRRLKNSLHRHVVLKHHFAFVHAALNWCGA